MRGQLLTVGQVALRLRRTPDTIKRMADDGRLPVIRTPSGRRIFREKDVRRYEEARGPRGGGSAPAVAE